VTCPERLVPASGGGMLTVTVPVPALAGTVAVRLPELKFVGRFPPFHWIFELSA